MQEEQKTGDDKGLTSSSAHRTEGYLRPSYEEWITQHRQAAKERGGKAFRFPRDAEGHKFPVVKGRQTGEIVNPLTGEIVTGCLTVSKLAAQLGTSSQQVNNALEKMGAVVRVLRPKERPMLLAPHLTKTSWERQPEATGAGIEDGLVIQLRFGHGNRESECILVTPSGQAAVSGSLKGDLAPTKPGKVEAKQKIIRALIDEGLTQAQIARKTGWPRQTVSRLIKSMCQKNEQLSHFLGLSHSKAQQDHKEGRDGQSSHGSVP